MDWKYKHFNSERTFQAPRYEAFEAARSFMAESLGWQIEDTVDGFVAHGSSFSHAATAKFRIEPALGGTKVAVELLVERASALGFMLVDIGGYYYRQIQKWFEGIQWDLHNRLASSTVQGLVAGKSEPFPAGIKPAAMPTDWKSRPSSGFNRVFAAILILWGIIAVASFFIFPAIGLLTGSLYIPGRGSGRLTIHGIWARIISAMILIIATFAVWKIRQSLISQNEKKI